uniref:Uncharacterized protein n=1 Tax=Rhizophora mucronata TaxID=61149 RepID=A0A2P2QC13_RHIMU
MLSRLAGTGDSPGHLSPQESQAHFVSS